MTTYMDFSEKGSSATSDSDVVFDSNYLFLLKGLAQTEGFEPPTNWFEANYSIQLSYVCAYDRPIRDFMLITSRPPCNYCEAIFRGQ